MALSILNDRQKRFIICFLLMFQLFFIPRQAKALGAEALLALDTGVLSGLSEGAVGLISVAAPYALPIAIASISAGVLYKNRTQLYAFVEGAMGYLNSCGQGIGKGIIDTGNGVSVMTQTAKEKLLDYISQCKGQAVSFVKPLINTMSIRANSGVQWLDLFIPVSSSLNVAVGLMATGRFNISNVSLKYRIDDYPKTWDGSKQDVIAWDSTNSLNIHGNYITMPTMNHVQIGIENTGSFDTDVGIVQTLSTGNSICADATGSYSGPFANTGSISVAPTATTWDDVISATPATVGDIAKIGDATATDTGTDSKAPTIDIDVPANDTPKLDFAPLMVATQKFPFSLPWDLWDTYKVFEADSQTFYYKFDKIDVDFAFIGCGTITAIPEFELNFADYPKVEEAIKIFKYLELMAFIFFIIIQTRRLIRG